MSHAHHHDPSRPHPDPLEDDSGRKHPKFAVLEIGDELGALIVHAEPDMHGVEIEISPAGHDQQRSHREVLERSIGGRPAFTALFDKLTAGSYTLWVAGEVRARDIAIEGGAIAELDWRAAEVPR